MFDIWVCLSLLASVVVRVSVYKMTLLLNATCVSVVLHQGALIHEVTRNLELEGYETSHSFSFPRM